MGHSTSSGRETASVWYDENGAAVVGIKQNRSVERTIDKAKFTEAGFGTWEIEVPNVGGAQILDASDSRENSFGAFGGKLYEVRAWDGDFNDSGRVERYESLNSAKRGARDMIKRLNGVFG